MYESMVFYRSFYEAIKDLPQEAQGRIYTAIFAYGLDGKEPELSGLEMAIFTLIKPQIDANNRKRDNGRNGAAYGQRGGRPKQENPTETATKPQENGKETATKPQENGKETAKKPQENGKETAKKPQENPKQTPNVNVNGECNNGECNNGECNNENGECIKAHTPTQTDPEEKQLFGLYHNVRLTDGELQAMMDTYPDDYRDMIENLSAYMKSKGRYYDDHFATMMRWKRQDAEKAKAPAPPPKHGTKEELARFYQMVDDWATREEATSGE